MSCGVSIIIPVYNGEKYIKKCVESVMDQTYKKIEIIVLNDGSRDNTEKICTELKNEDLRIQFINKKNTGLGSTRNMGIKVSKNSYITFLDADDWLEKDYVEKIVKGMKKENVKIGVCDINYYDNITGDKLISKIRLKNGVSELDKDISIINKARTFSWGKIYEKNLFHENVLYPNWNFEDIPCTPIIVFEAKRIFYVPDALYNYRRNQSESLSNNINNINDIFKSLVLLNKRFKIVDTRRLMFNEIKKIMMGQLRFALVRWGKSKDLRVKKDLEKINQLVYPYYKCSKKFEEIIFASEKDELLYEALLCVTVNKEQIVEAGKKADYYVGYHIFGNMKSMYWINISHQYLEWNDKEVTKWEIAEKIMEKM